MVNRMLENSKIIYLMVKDIINGMTEENISESGITVNCMGKDF